MPRNRPGAAPTNVGNRKICCIYNWDPDTGDESTGYTRSCAAVPDDISETDCVTLRNITLTDGTVVQRPIGDLVECCRDCTVLPRALTVANGKLVWLGDSIATTPIEEPEKCCCGDIGCCRQVPDCTQVDCYPTSPDECDPCKGRCISHQYDDNGEEILEDRDVLCATSQQCCAEDDIQCSPKCVETLGPVQVPIFYDPPENSWLPMPCTKCGTCCQHVYDLTSGSSTYRQSLFTTYAGGVTEEECLAATYDANVMGPALGPFGVWTPNVDDPNICNPDCCKELPRGAEIAVACQRTDQIACDPCVGRCVDLTADADPNMCPKETCKTKSDCCGDGNENCMPGVCAPGAPALFRWESLTCGTDGDYCGVCCKNIYNDDGTVAIGVECDPDTSNKEDCEVLIEQLSGMQPYGVWHAFGTCADCGDVMPCCREVTCPGGGTKTVCVNVPKDECDPCNGSCIELNDDGTDGNATCSSYYDCCGDDGSRCEVAQCGVTPTHRWTPTCLTTTDLCGACCRVTYLVDQTTGELTYYTSDCMDDITDAKDCVLTEAERLSLAPDFTAAYSWRPYETCATAACSEKTCCGETCPDDVGCVSVPFDDDCDPCKGRCFDKENDEKSCKTKQECCGDDGLLCRGCPDGSGPPGRFEWSGCFENGFKCGICCQLTLNAAGEAISSECHDDITYAECSRLPNASWKAFETCASAVCIPKSCCNDEICPGQVICTVVDKDRGACDDPCNGECYDIDEAGQRVGDPFCASKQSCCGSLNEKCSPPAGFCPDDGTPIPTRAWDSECADPELCGVCCKKTVADGGAITYSCDDTKDNKTDCEANDFGVWSSFGTCADCGGTRTKCIETQCRVDIDGQSVTVSSAACRPVAPSEVDCKGVCTELATDTRPYAITTCKTKEECCGADGSKCRSTGCDSVVTHTFDSACIDGEKCGVCCIVTNIGDGNLTPGAPQLNIGRAACEDLNTATPRFGIGNTTTWIPFGSGSDCGGTPCATLCPDGSAQCINKLAPEVCPEPCNGLCVDVDGTVSLKTKADCCVVGGVNLCALTDARCPKPTWTVVCAESADKCGVACKTTYDVAGTEILSSECVAGLTTKAAMDLAQAGAPAGVVYTWHPWETCESVICRPKICCGTICTDEDGNDVVGCKTVDYNAECDKCRGVCYAATYDPNDNRIYKNADAVGQCLTLVECCGAIGEKCSRIDNCPVNNYNIYEPCDATRCPTKYSCPCLDGQNPATTPRVDFAANSKTVFNELPGGLRGVPDYTDFKKATGSCSVTTSLRHCPNGCEILASGTGWNWCVDPVTGFPPPTGPNPITFKNCYPQAINDEPTYLYTAERYAFYTRNDVLGIIREEDNFEIVARCYQRKLAVYACRDDKLVDVTEELFDVHPIELCVNADRNLSSRLHFDNVLTNYTVTDIQFFRTVPDRQIYRATYSTTALDDLMIGSCESTFDDLTESSLKDCPQAPAENPLP